jgi:hypothetical protein
MIKKCLKLQSKKMTRMKNHLYTFNFWWWHSVKTRCVDALMVLKDIKDKTENI